MIKIEFDLMQRITIILVDKNDTFQIAINRFISKHPELDPKTLVFIANGKQLNPNSKIGIQMSNINKQNNTMQILVNIFSDIEHDIIVDSKEVICPLCKDSCRIKFDQGKIILFNCKNNHKKNILNILDFPETQKINLSKIICDDCKKKEKNMGQSYNQQFYKCLTCKNNICLLCEPKHNKDHKIIKYESKNYICQKHNDPFIKFCNNCKLNICLICDDEHKNHDTTYFGSILPKAKKIEETRNNIIKECEIFQNNIKEIINKLNNLLVIINTFKKITVDIINKFDTKNKNYNILENIKEITDNNELYKKIKKINTSKNWSEKSYDMIQLYSEINNPLILNKIKLIYKIKNEFQIKLFDTTFIKNNKDKCYLIVDYEKIELCEKLKVTNFEKDFLEMELIEIHPIKNMSHMFCNCNTLLSLPDISQFDTKDVIDMSYMFYSCYSLQSLPDISK